LFPYFRPQDLVDIIIMSFLVYQLYRWFKNTKALQIVIGLGFLVVLYFVTKNLDLYMTSWILQQLGTVLFILIIVIFQTEIRQALYRFSPLRNLFGRQGNGLQLDLIEVSRTIFELAGEKTGAIIVFQRKEPIDEYLMHGVPLDSLVSAQLLASIFSKGTPLHDGAVVIRDGRLTQASCHLPLSANADLPQHYGTRHRAALGLSERCDAAIITVSEERGEVTLALSGFIEKIDTPEHLSEKLHEFLVPADQEVVRVSLRHKVFSNLRPKLITLFLVFLSWLVITAKQGGILTVTSPIKFHNLPGNLVLVRSIPEEVDVQVKVISRLIPPPQQLDIVADVDLAKIREGTNHLSIKSDDIQLPLGVTLSGINPSVVKVIAERKVRKNLLVRAKTIGSLPEGKQLRKIRITPASVAAEGPEHVMTQLDSVTTEEIDLAGVGQNMVVEKGLLQPAPQVKILRDDPVKVQLVVSGS
jgi:diadenylate cyclase